jgi:hypothetical protein
LTEKDAEIDASDLCEDVTQISGFGWRVSLSIIVGIGWLVFLVLWLGFIASYYNVYQNIATFLVSILVMGGILGTAWVSLGKKFGNVFEKEKMKHEGYRWRKAFSSVLGTGLLIFVIFWFFFYAGDYSIYQNLAILLVAALVVGGVMGIVWATWTTKYRSEIETELMMTAGFGWRVGLSIGMGAGLLLFLVLWFFFIAGDFSIYQNIAIFIVSFLIVGGVLGAAWAPWGIKYGRKFKK